MFGFLGFKDLNFNDIFDLLSSFDDGNEFASPFNESRLVSGQFRLFLSDLGSGNADFSFNLLLVNLLGGTDGAGLEGVQVGDGRGNFTLESGDCGLQFRDFNFIFLDGFSDGSNFISEGFLCLDHVDSLLMGFLGELDNFIGDFLLTSWDLEWEWVRWFAIIFVIIGVLSIFLLLNDVSDCGNSDASSSAC